MSADVTKLRPGMRALVVGLAKSGEAVARLLLRRGLSVLINERRERDPSDYAAAELEAMGARLEFGGHPLEVLDFQPDFIVKNPGIPYSVPLFVEAQQRAIPIYTEIEVASWLTTSPIFSITGSNGKTTTTTLVGEILTQAGQNPQVAGNIGRVLSGVIEQVQPSQPIVLEVSSFQLMGTRAFHPKIAALLNLYPAHLDYHGSYEAYVEAKWKMFGNMTAQDTAVLNYDQDEIRSGASRLGANVVWFSKASEVPQGMFVQDGQVVLKRDGEKVPVMPIAALALKGEHNVENSLAASAIAVWAGAPIEAVEYVLTRFRGVEHRLEFVKTVEGVDYYNDSKATNPEAALRALRSFPSNIVWIAGGLDRGVDFKSMASDVRGRVKSAVLLGQSKDALAAMLKETGTPFEFVSSIEQAVLTAHRMSSPGDVVVLSPACASWDMFQSFEQRGRMFKDVVHTL
ncbi:UDP-N-acetylmuramoyl-L-alanine--D-glutamate ligase [Alicyclobacillus tolerans]|uniref:UDP-N-acetylmuramoyl-L-alanine--D-glutamate ligase n=1 Tax=Alicyclobacillus tolerans TaxID=90970 RepID=UPI001F02061E|nr:UDP-N-acetylmuramoyl-L-alanine--D-glutamate ligase [Alicyclobacillus tolerans]MCF8564479.1 UDP-N-acetylmuramoyl-L-alanine--D-glutamate ligase [Alicyclobacillus tolerans]